MRKKSDKGDGVSFSPEFREIVRRLKGKEPELDETLNHEGSVDHAEEDGQGPAESTKGKE